MSVPLRAGSAHTDITPPLGTHLAGLFSNRLAEDVADPLRAKAVLLEQGETRLALVVLDLLCLPRAEVQRIRELIAARLSIPPTHVLIGCTHTHTGPSTRVNPFSPRDETYMDWLVSRVADCVQLAANRAEPARIGWGAGRLDGVCFCRRFRMKDGTVRMNPGRGNPDIVEPTSPTDPTVGTFYVESLIGTPIAVVAQYGLHYVGTDHPNHVSADYYGHFDRAIRRFLGEQCTPLLFNGTSGQVNAVDINNSKQERGHAYARKVANALAGEVIKTISKLVTRETCHLAAESVVVRLPRKRVSENDLEVARSILAGSDPHPHQGPFEYVVGMPIPERLRERYASGCLALAHMPAEFESEVQALRIGELGWVGLPGEIFVETGLAIKEAAPSRFAFVSSLTNDAMGYIPPDPVFLNEGGYETWAQAGNPVGIGGEPTLRSAALDLMDSLFQSTPAKRGA